VREDVAFAFGALRETLRDAVAATWGAWDEARQRALFAPSFDVRTHRILVSAGEDAGVLATESLVHCIHLARLLLLPAWQRRGIGARVVRAVVAAAHARGVPVEVTVLHANPGARRFYERLGFSAVGETSTHVHLEAPPREAALSLQGGSRPCPRS
jgi:GNAT superfamily N-acetyltransferase